jgi:hypothetical protein
VSRGGCEARTASGEPCLAEPAFTYAVHCHWCAYRHVGAVCAGHVESSPHCPRCYATRAVTVIVTARTDAEPIVPRED